VVRNDIVVVVVVDR